MVLIDFDFFVDQRYVGQQSENLSRLGWCAMARRGLITLSLNFLVLRVSYSDQQNTGVSRISDLLALRLELSLDVNGGTQTFTVGLLTLCVLKLDVVA